MNSLECVSDRQLTELVYSLEKIKGWIEMSWFNRIEQQLIERGEKMELRQLGLCLYILMKVESRKKSNRK